MQDVGGVDEQVRPAEVGESGDVVAEFGELPFGGAPGEVAVGLREAEFGQPVLAGRRRERLGQEEHVGIGVLDLTDQPGPEVGRLGVRIVDPKDLDAVVNPVPDHAQHLVVEPGGIVVEVERIDVLVFLRRILRVGDGAVRQFGEPLPVLAGPRMIRCALQRQVQGHLHAQIACRGDEVVEVVDGAQARDEWRRGRPRRCRSPTAIRRLRERRWESCCGPCDVPCRSGGSAAGTRRRTPSRRCAEGRAAAVAKVPCTGLPSASQPPVERGNISYHEPKRASGRSTQTPYCSPRVTSIPQRIGGRAVRRSRVPVPARCASPGHRGSAARRRRPAAVRGAARGTPVAARSNSAAPTNRSLDSSVSPWPASSLATSPCRQV